ncbi:MAG: hypothetical protein R2784_04115 [Saprospiraceae bacterium]
MNRTGRLFRIEAGVELIIDTGVYINAFGPVEILGTIDEPVYLNSKFLERAGDSLK